MVRFIGHIIADLNSEEILDLLNSFGVFDVISIWPNTKRNLDFCSQICEQYKETQYMPQIEVLFYQEKNGTVPVLGWLDGLKPKVFTKCRVRIERLRNQGHELRRPEADYLQDGIYELRVGLEGINYRMLYFFHGSKTAVISHGLVKEQIIPRDEIEKAIVRKNRFAQDPKRHTYRET